MKYRHFSNYERGSNFNNLSGEKQRAIETQANIDTEAYKLSRYYKPALKTEETEQQLFNMLCDEYSNKSDIEIKKMVILDSKALYYYPLTKDRHEYYERLAKEEANRIDKKIYIESHMHFGDYSR